MDIAKVRDLTDQELADELTDARRQLYDLRFQLATRQLTDYSQLARTRRTIARLLTVQTERGEASLAAAPTGRAASRARSRAAGDAS